MTSRNLSTSSVEYVRPKIKFYLLGIAARPTEKLAAQIILFAFQTKKFLLKKSESRRNFDRVRKGSAETKIMSKRPAVESIPLCCNASVKGGEQKMIFYENSIWFLLFFMLH